MKFINNKVKFYDGYLKIDKQYINSNSNNYIYLNGSRIYFPLYMYNFSNIFINNKYKKNVYTISYYFYKHKFNLNLL